MQRLPPAFLIAVTMAQIPGCHLGRPTGAAAWCRLGGNAFARPWTQAAGPWLRMRASSPNHARGVAAKSGGDASPATTAAAAAPAVEPKLNHAGPPLPPASSFRRPARIADVLAFPETEGRAVEVLGWVRSARAQKSVAFLDVSDGSCASGVQVVVSAAAAPEAFARVSDGLTPTGAAVRVSGTLVAAKGKASQSKEVSATRIDVVGPCDASSYPLQKKRHSLAFLRTQLHLRPRTTTFAAVSRIRHTLFHATHGFFDAHGFTYVSTPLITQSDCEGAGEAFRLATDPATPSPGEGGEEGGEGAETLDAEALRDMVAAQGAAVRAAKDAAKARGEDPNAASRDAIATLLSLKDRLASVETAPSVGEEGKEGGGEFFGGPAYLTVSGQLNAEAFACAMRDVYTFGPTFRAENSNTPRHLAEFWMVEPELAFCDMDALLACAQAYVKHCLGAVLRENASDVAFLERRAANEAKETGAKEREKRFAFSASYLEGLAEGPWHRVSYTEAVRLLGDAVGRGDASFEFPVAWGSDLQTEHERYLAEVVFGGQPVFVTDYPAAIKAFYMRRNQGEGEGEGDRPTVAATDLLVPGVGELIGGSVREERLGVLEAAMVAKGLNPQEDLQWYQDLRRFGSVPHAGFGLGFERLVQLATGLDNIRDVIPFPRYPGHADV